MFSGPPRSSRQTIEDLPRINVRELCRQAGSLPSERLVLKIGGVEHVIRLHVRPGELGGTIVQGAFCPRCNACRLHLYVRGGVIGCRDKGCLDLGWSRHWERGVSVMSLIRRARRKLNADLMPLSPLPARPFYGGRAAARHDKLVREIIRLESELLAGLDGLTAKLDRHGYGHEQ
jgi:hypothetical protein